MDSLTLFIAVAIVAFIVTIINPFYVLPLFMFGNFLLPMQYLPELRQYNPTTILGVLVLAASLFHLAVHKDFEPAKSKQVTMMCLFILWAAISSRINADTSWGVFMVYLRTFIPYFLFLYIVRTRQQLTIIIWLLLFLATAAAIYGLYCLKENIGIRDRGIVRIMSFFDNPNDFGQTLALLMPFAFGLLFYKYPKAVKGFLSMILALIITGIVISYSRKCFFAIFAVPFLFVFKFFKGGKKITAGILAIILLLMATYFFPDPVKWRYWARVRTIFRAESAEQLDAGRTETAKAGLKIMLQHPVLGVGFGGFKDEYIKVAGESADIALIRGGNIDPHNAYLEAGAKLGVVGLLFYLLLIYYAYRDSMKAEQQFILKKDDFFRIVAVSHQTFILLYLFLGVFSNILTSKIFWMVVPLSAVLKRLSLKETLDDTGNRSVSARIK
jgi:O-antigen ligase